MRKLAGFAALAALVIAGGRFMRHGHQNVTVASLAEKQSMRDAPTNKDMSVDENGLPSADDLLEHAKQPVQTNPAQGPQPAVVGAGSSEKSLGSASSAGQTGDGPDPDWSSRKNRWGVVCLDGAGGASLLDPSPDVLYKCEGSNAQGYDSKTGAAAGAPAACVGGCFPHAGDHDNGPGAICVMDRLGYEYENQRDSVYRCVGNKMQLVDPKTQDPNPMELTCPGGCARISNARAATPNNGRMGILDECRTGSDCESGQHCVAGSCQYGNDNPYGGVECYSNTDCRDGDFCESNQCVGSN